VVSGLGNIACFFREKPARAIIALGCGKTGWYASLLAKEIDCTFPHIINILSRFERLGLVSFKAEGRKKLIALTPKGKRLAEAFSKIVGLLGQAAPSWKE